MTLAAIFLSLSLAQQTAALQGMPVVQAQSTAPATTSDSATQDQSNSQQSPSSSSPAPPSSKTTPATTGSKPHAPLRHKKKVAQANCNAPSGASPSATGQTAASGKSAGSGNGSASNSAQAKTSGSSNCPPSKVIVRQGGTSEPAIQLAGGDDSSKTRGDATQNLATAEANLQKIAGRDLTPGQRDMVTQIGKFMDQSKAATAAGDLERARTLAWKAQTLSEELVNPQK
jgi:hypothetical protein